MADHHRTAEHLADVPWLEASRRSHANWPVRLALLGTGCALLVGALDPTLGALTLVALVVVGGLLATVGLVMGAAYGRVLGGLVAALDAGYPPHWLAARRDLHEGDAASLAAELKQLVEGQPVR